MFFEDYTEKLWGVHPRDISADWGAQRVKGLSVSKAIKNALTKPFRKKGGEVETSLIEQFLYPKKGPGQLYEKMAEKIVEMGGKIYFSSPVTKIKTSGDKVTSVITSDGREYTADYFISSMPIKDFIEAVGKEHVPCDAYRVATELPYRDFITVGCFWIS